MVGTDTQSGEFGEQVGAHTLTLCIAQGAESGQELQHFGVSIVNKDMNQDLDGMMVVVVVVVDGGVDQLWSY